jgi:CheY-like chemotaxis protein
VQPISDNLTDIEARLANAYGVKPSVRARGCTKCGMTGYRGRTPVNEVFLPTPPMLEAVATGASAQELQRLAMAAGMRPMREVALEKVRLGTSTLQEVERVLGEGISEAPAPIDQPHILLVDDDPTIRTLARLLLEKNGFRVVEVGDGAAAMEHLAAGGECGLVVLDLDMPALGGLEVLRRVRSSASTAGVPVVVLTGSEGDEVEIDAMNAGADDYIRKPLEPGRFVARVKAALRRAGS